MIVKNATILVLFFWKISTWLELLLMDYSEKTPATLSLDQIRERGNALIDEPSLYLQQHARNPVYWHPWNEEALARARDEDKPIFLSSGYSSCHWCHVMEHEVFEKDDVAAYLNEHFVSIKIDREERPDLDATYMEAVHLLNGRGGWPMSVFLTADLKPFYGGTYLPHKPFLDLLQRIVAAHADRREELQKQADHLAQGIARGSQALPGEGEGLGAEIIDQAVAKAKQQYDEQYGGFRQAQKFPTPIKWRFLLHEYRRRPNAELRQMIAHSLEAMARGGLYDHVGGGFHRYTVDQAWTVPHFEKMLYDNAQLAGLMLEAGVALGRDDFTALGRDTLDFLLREMRDEKGGIYASFDADSGGDEGSYYVWNPAEIAAVAGKEDGLALAAVLGVTPDGNFESTGSSVITRRADVDQLSGRFGLSPLQLDGLFDQHRQALRQARERRVAPTLDRKIVTSWNGLTITALAQAFAVSGEERYLDAARSATDFLLGTHLRPDNSLWRTSCDGRPSGDGVLDDYAFLVQALIEVFQVTGESRYLQAARLLTDRVLAGFSRPGGGFFLSASGVAAPLGRRIEYFDSVEPSGCSVMLDNLIRLGAVTGEMSYTDRARQDLDAVSDMLERMGLEMSGWLDAGRKLVDPFFDVVIAGEDRRLAEDLRTHLPATAVVSLVPAAGADPDLAALAPALAGKTARDGKTTAYVCREGTCHEPTTDAGEMMRLIGIPS
jgi:uncharacterized protein YyaL (SSP411 family)